MIHPSTVFWHAPISQQLTFATISTTWINHLLQQGQTQHNTQRFPLPRTIDITKGFKVVGSKTHKSFQHLLITASNTNFSTVCRKHFSSPCSRVIWNNECVFRSLGVIVNVVVDITTHVEYRSVVFIYTPAPIPEDPPVTSASFPAIIFPAAVVTQFCFIRELQMKHN